MKRVFVVAALLGLVVNGLSADACERCRERARQAAAEQACGVGVGTETAVMVWTAEKRAADPVGYAEAALETASEELQLKLKAQDRLRKTAVEVQGKRAKSAEELAELHSQLEVIRCHQQRGCYPVQVAGVCLRNSAASRRLASTLLLRARTLEQTIAVMDQELRDGSHEEDQLSAEIVSLQLEIAMTSHRTERILANGLPGTAVGMMAGLREMLPKETAEIAAQRIMVAQFLATPAAQGVEHAEAECEALVR